MNFIVEAISHAIQNIAIQNISPKILIENSYSKEKRQKNLPDEIKLKIIQRDLGIFL